MKQATLAQERETPGGFAPLEQQLAKLFVESFARQFRQVEGRAEFDQVRVDRHTESRRHLRNSQGAQGIFAKTRGVGRAQHLRLEIGAASVRIQQLAGGQFDPHAVDRQVASPGRFVKGKLWVELDFETPVPRGHFAVSAGQRKINRESANDEYAEGLTDRQNFAETRQHAGQKLVLEIEDFDVEILDRQPEQSIANRATDQYHPPTGFPERSGDFQQPSTISGRFETRKNRRRVHRFIRPRFCFK